VAFVPGNCGEEGEGAFCATEVEILVSTETKHITGTQYFLKSDQLHVRGKLVQVELQELK
jgi:hypothetical protein